MFSVSTELPRDSRCVSSLTIDTGFCTEFARETSFSGIAVYRVWGNNLPSHYMLKKRVSTWENLCSELKKMGETVNQA